MADSTPFDRLATRGRGKGRLPPAPAREALPVSVSEAVPSGATPGTDAGAVTVSPVALVSSDGLFSLAGFATADGAFYISDPAA